MKAVPVDAISKPFRWLGHQEHWTELVAIHPDYRRGASNYAWNRNHQSFPRISYARHEVQLQDFINRYSRTHMVCYGLNPRPRRFTNERGYPRAAKDREIAVSQNLLFDFDLQGEPTEERLGALQRLVRQIRTDVHDRELKLPVLASSGRGYHLLFAYPPIRVSESPDIAERLRRFRAEFAASYREKLGQLEAELDKTADLGRRVRTIANALLR